MDVNDPAWYIVTRDKVMREEKVIEEGMYRQLLPGFICVVEGKVPLSM